VSVSTWTCRQCQTNNPQNRDRCSYCNRHRKNDISVPGLLSVLVFAIIFFSLLAWVLHQIYG
jgi:hypothetical protein